MSNLSRNTQHSALSRRAFLKVAGASALAWWGAACQSAPTPQATVTPPATSTPYPITPAPTTLQITPVGTFYRQSFRAAPEVDRANWRLTIDGLVDHPLTLTFDDLQRLPALHELRTLECIGNPVGGPLIGTARWTGTLLAPLLQQVGVRPRAIRARFEAADGYSTSVERHWLEQPETLLIYAMNDAPLTREHGFPVRVLMPGLYGQKNPKWLTRIEWIDYEHEGYWEAQGWSERAAVKTTAIIRHPAASVTLQAGAVVPIWGVAFAGKRRITQVEVQIDGGGWQATELLQGDSPLVWTQWAFEWRSPLEAGRHTIAARATDETGFTQSNASVSVLDDAFPSGTDKIHSLLVALR